MGRLGGRGRGVPGPKCAVTRAWWCRPGLLDVHRVQLIALLERNLLTETSRVVGSAIVDQGAKEGDMTIEQDREKFVVSILSDADRAWTEQMRARAEEFKKPVRWCVEDGKLLGLDLR